MRATTLIESLEVSPVTVALLKTLNVRNVAGLSELNDLDLYTVPDMGPSRIEEIALALGKGRFRLSNDEDWTQGRLVAADAGDVDSPRLLKGQRHLEARRLRLADLTPDQFVHRIKRGSKDRSILPASDFPFLVASSGSRMVRAWAGRVCASKGIPLEGPVDPNWLIYRPSRSDCAIAEANRLRIVLEGTPDMDERRKYVLEGWLRELKFDELRRQRALDRPYDALFAHEVECLASHSLDWNVRRTMNEVLSAQVRRAERQEGWFEDVVSEALYQRSRKGDGTPWIEVARIAARKRRCPLDDFLEEAAARLLQGYKHLVDGSEGV